MSSKIVRTAIALVALATLPARAEEFRFAEDTSPRTLHPAFTTSMVETRMNELVFAGLFRDNQLLEPEPYLAESYAIADDKKSITITLGDKLWHDGKPVTPSDVKFTVEALQNPRTGSRDRVRVAFIKSVEVTGPKALRIQFRSPLATPLRKLYFKILPAHMFKGTALKTTDPFRKQPVGAGPFRVEQFNKNEVKLSRIGSAGRGIRQMRAMLSSPKSTQLDMLKYAYLEAIVRVPPNFAADLAGAQREFELHSYESLTWWYLGLNHKDRNLAKPEVREALAYALDRKKIREAHLGDGTTISGPFAPRSAFYNTEVKPRDFSIAKADTLMAKAGFKKKNGLYRDRRNRTVKLRMVMNNDWKLLYRDVAISMESELKNAGFDVRLIWQDGAKWYDSVRRKKDFEVTLGIWTFDEGSNVFGLFHSKGASNFINYRSKKMDTLLDQSEEVADPDVFFSIYLKVHQLANEELPYVFLWSVPSYSAITSKIYDVEIHPFNYFGWVTSWKYRK